MKEFTVLAIDDNESNLFTLECVLNQIDSLNIIKKGCGNEGLEVVKKTPVDLIIVDVQMPGMNGFEFVNELKAIPDASEIPVIFLTAYFKSDEFASRGYKLGAIDYLSKPIDEFRLLNKITLYKELFEKNEQLKQANIELTKLVQELKDANSELEKLKAIN